MPNQKFKMPTYEDADQRAFYKLATPLDVFIVDNTPAGQEEERKFLDQLEQAIIHVIQNEEV